MYWQLSPRESEVIVRGTIQRLRREHNDRMTLAYYTAAIPNSKKPIALRDLLVDLEDKPKTQDWRQIKAALLWAMPPKGNG